MSNSPHLLHTKSLKSPTQIKKSDKFYQIMGESKQKGMVMEIQNKAGEIMGREGRTQC